MKMNVFKFHILLESKENIKSATVEITNTYASKSTISGDYKDYVLQTWSDSKKEKIRALYPTGALLACCKKSRCTYFIVDVDSNYSIDQLTVEVFVISELNDVNDAYNKVYNDLNQKMNKKFKISLVEKQALLYIYEGNDIIATHVMIKADIIAFTKFSSFEIIRIVILVIFILGCLITTTISENYSLNNIMFSLVASSIFFIISEFLVKMRRSKILEIKNFTNWVKTEERDEIIDTQETFLANPEY